MKKLTSLTLALASAVLLFTGCSKDDETTPGFNEEARKSSMVDEVADDVAAIAEDQYNAQSMANRMQSEAVVPFLPECATVTTVVSGSTWQRTIDFGSTGCTLNNGNVVSGTIVVNGSLNFSAPSQTISYTFINFHHNNRLVEGNRTITHIPSNQNGNPQSTISLDMTVTFADGTAVTRQGNRVREMVAGQATPHIFGDNEYSVTGAWTTTFPNAVHAATVTSPLHIKISCPHIVSGILNITRNGNQLVFDYGSGTCDNDATLSVNGGAPVAIVLGN